MRWRCVWLCVLAFLVNAYARLARNHVNNICSTWGRDHFKTFDGDMYQFPGLCEYNLVSDCHEVYQEFSVHMKRTDVDGSPTVSYVVVTINDLSFHLTKSRVTVNDVLVNLPYINAGVQVEKNAVYIKLQSKVGLSVLWNGDDAIMVELEHEYNNRTCGLCGDFNGVPIYNEFIHDGRKISPIEFGNKQKVHRPNDDCEDPYEEEDEPLGDVQASCEKFQPTCDQALHSDLWSPCTELLNPKPYIQACVQDMCGCSNNTDDLCHCSTLSEFSRQCSHAGGQPPKWRTSNFCAKQCPYNMVYEESSPPCMDTCTYQDTTSMCEDHKMDGCFCPPGTVFDDISERGCIVQSECQCQHDKVYNPGEVYRQDAEECTCFGGKWKCKSLQAPATCAVEEGSHITTFDGKTYTFHGECFYTLARVEAKDNNNPAFRILAELRPCTNQEFDTCLKALKILLNNDRNNVLMFTSDGTVKQNMQAITLPYSSGNIDIFHASSFHILLQTRFGLKIQIQHVPIMQVYISLEQDYKTKTRGLCGNYNMILSDDMKTPQRIVAGTAATFANSWKANARCRDKEERMDDPCSLSVENEKYAKHWCALLQSPDHPFAQCHPEVDPEVYYKRCIYASCNCERSESCLCAVLSSYARACAAKGVFLTDWRDDVCGKYSNNCPNSQTFSYKHQRCQLTCSSLASKQSCSNDFLPVDGCSCADGFYLDDKGICVPREKCHCHHNGVDIKPGKSISINDEHCVCTNGVLHCRSWRAHSLSACPPHKVYVNCSTVASGELGAQCAPTCATPNSEECSSIDCESGCKCPDGLLDDGKGLCVKQHECPCPCDGNLYASGSKIHIKCNTCTCKSGEWECTEKICPGTCVIYGSGHYSTFDQRTYGFHGDCRYVAVKNACGNKTAQVNFEVITENVQCGSTGTTCSKNVRIRLGSTEIYLTKGDYEKHDLGHGVPVTYRVRKVGLYLIVESDIGLAVMWDRKTSVRILLEPEHKGEVCGLCGNFDGDGKNDFTTQGMLVVSGPIEFANSWKVSSTCPNVEASTSPHPCDAKPNRHPWAKKMCTIIRSDTFKECHLKVPAGLYYENCVRDSCACDTGGDCECYCSAVAAYAQACNEAGVCVAWRTPELCPVFCDYYNSLENCTWHYSPCHKPCYKTCLNLDGNCSNPLPKLEGCYPKCPKDKPIFDEDKQECVEECPITTTPTPTPTPTPTSTAEPTTTTQSTPTPTPTPTELTTTTPEPTTTTPEPTTTTPEPTTTPTTVLTTTTPEATSTTQFTTLASTTCKPTCDWSDWYDVHHPSLDKNDWETYENITNSGREICENPREIDCRGTRSPSTSFDDYLAETKQVATCNVSYGLICKQTDQPYKRKCHNYKIRVCCLVPCATTASPTTTTQSTTTPSGPTTTTPQPTTTTPEPTTTPTTELTTTTPEPTTTPTTVLTTTTPKPTTTTPELTTPTTVLTTTTAEPTTTPTTVLTTTTPKPTTPTPEPTTTPTTVLTTTTPEPTTTPTTVLTTTTPKPTTTTPEPTTTTPEATTTTQSTPTPTEPTTTTRPTFTSSTTFYSPEAESTTPPQECVCEINGKKYKEGEIISQKHVGSALCSIMRCLKNCVIGSKTESCCPVDADKETFHLCNCTMARCTDNHTVEIVPYECPPIEPVTCENGKPPVLVYDEYGCCQYRACDCVCEGWGDPHYVTFDGLYYSYQGNCTYILMEESFPKHDLKIYIDSVNCDPTEDVSCPRSIIVSYRSQAITLKNHNLLDRAELEAFKGEQSLDLPYWNDGIKVVTTGLNLVLEIPRLEVVVKFGISGFIVNLPYQHFGSNTQGHCGTCNNNQADDCKLPDGRVVGSCDVMADHWLAKDKHQPMCKIPSVVPTSKPEPPTKSRCRPDSLCDMLHSSPFTACHSVVSPNNFYKGCVFDRCRINNPAVDCTSLQTYAAACAQVGVCLHWRNYTSLCASGCPPDKVYKPCGPVEQPTCEDNANEPVMNVTTEGCFCPDGMKLFNKESGICVSKCGCLDPEGIPREFNERFEYKCQNCICDKSTKTVNCKPKACPAPPVANCTGPGFVLVNETNPSDPCCSAFVCRCHSTTCPLEDMNCPIGYKPVVTTPEGQCCPQHTCEAKRVCLHKNIEYEPGSKFPSGDCHNCTCTHEPDPKSDHLKTECERLPCEENCGTGYEYVYPTNGECCGKCEQTHCIFSLNGTKRIMKEGETRSPSDNKCERFICTQIGGVFTAVNSHIVCPPFQQSNCEPGTIQTSANGCCQICVERDKACKLQSVRDYISHNGCTTEEQVEIPYCEGSCNTFAKYSAAAANIEHTCSCCKETRFSRRTVDLKCMNGDVVPHKYDHVEECSCGNTECTAAGQPARKKRSFRLV